MTRRYFTCFVDGCRCHASVDREREVTGRLETTAVPLASGSPFVLLESLDAGGNSGRFAGTVAQ
jgi:hypothetical protein